MNKKSTLKIIVCSVTFLLGVSMLLMRISNEGFMVEMNIEALSQSEGPNFGTCCPMSGKTCQAGEFLFNNYTYQTSGPCPTQ